MLLKSHNFSVTKYLSGLNINLENREEGEEKDLHYLFFLFPDWINWNMNFVIFETGSVVVYHVISKMCGSVVVYHVISKM